MPLPRLSLVWKLVAINLLGVGVVIVLAWQVIDHFAANYFMGLMREYNIDPEVLHHAFLHTTHQFLLFSMVLGLGVVLLMSFVITRQVLGTLTGMSRATRRLAGGDYSERVRVTTRDEVGELGAAFNRMAASLERVEQLRKELVANVAHELRTPLHNLRGQLEAMQDRLMDVSPATIASLHDEVLRLVRLVEALHQLSRADAGARFLNKEPFELRAAIHQAIEQERAGFERKGIACELAGEPLTVAADPEQVRLALQNLARNLLQYTPQGGRAAVTLSHEGGNARVCFTNSGDGIRAEDLPHVFERFYRGEKSRSRDFGGAGIGLAIVKQAIEAHGGRIGAGSRPGHTEVWFTLPL
jgi:signal transduction histidine kinase